MKKLSKLIATAVSCVLLIATFVNTSTAAEIAKQKVMATPCVTQLLTSVQPGIEALVEQPLVKKQSFAPADVSKNAENAILVSMSRELTVIDGAVMNADAALAEPDDPNVQQNVVVTELANNAMGLITANSNQKVNENAAAKNLVPDDVISASLAILMTATGVGNACDESVTADHPATASTVH